MGIVVKNRRSKGWMKSWAELVSFNALKSHGKPVDYTRGSYPQIIRTVSAMYCCIAAGTRSEHMLAGKKQKTMPDASRNRFF